MSRQAQVAAAEVAAPPFVTGVEGDIIRGVGSSGPGLAPALARASARERARSELGKVLGVLTAATYKDYGCGMVAGCELTEEQKQLAAAGQRAKGVVGMLTATATVAEERFDAGVCWSVVTVTRAAWVEPIAATGDSERLRGFLRLRAEKNFEDLAAEEAAPMR